MITFEYLIDPTQKYSQNNCGIWMYSHDCSKMYQKLLKNDS